jgi:orotidine-5'-phosphate decarboxylase
MQPHEKIFVALDTPDAEGALRLVRLLEGRVGGFKVGLQLFSAAGPPVLREIRRSGAELFLDLKLHDIPNTVAGAAAAAVRLGANYFTMHASGGPTMIRRGVEAAAEAAEQLGLPRPTALAVTVLTSHDDDELQQIGLAGPCGAAVLRLADLARNAGAGGVVCSPLEVAAVRGVFPGGTLVVPGIRPGGGAAGANDDQSRVATPARAVESGADLLVIGRPISRAEDPAGAAEAIARSIERGEH